MNIEPDRAEIQAALGSLKHSLGQMEMATTQMSVIARGRARADVRIEAVRIVAAARLALEHDLRRFTTLLGLDDADFRSGYSLDNIAPPLIEGQVVRFFANDGEPQ